MLKPKCHPYWIIDGKKVKNTDKSSLILNARGNLLPCCWTDVDIEKHDLKKFGLYDDELKLENKKSVKEVLLSPQWVAFHRCLINDQENAPTICKKYCDE